MPPKSIEAHVVFANPADRTLWKGFGSDPDVNPALDYAELAAQALALDFQDRVIVIRLRALAMPAPPPALGSDGVFRAIFDSGSTTPEDAIKAAFNAYTALPTSLSSYKRLHVFVQYDDAMPPATTESDRETFIIGLLGAIAGGNAMSIGALSLVTPKSVGDIPIVLGPCPVISQSDAPKPSFPF